MYFLEVENNHPPVSFRLPGLAEWLDFIPRGNVMEFFLLERSLAPTLESWAKAKGRWVSNSYRYGLCLQAHSQTDH